MDPRKRSPTQKKSSSQLTTVYLLIYNSVLTIGLVKCFYLKKYKFIFFLLNIVGHLFYMKQ